MGNATNRLLAKNVVEPALIVLVFTIGALLNRRISASRSSKKHDEDDARTPLLPDETPPPCRHSSIKADSPPPLAWFPDTLRFRHTLLSRFLAKFPFLIEIWYWNLTYWVYQLARAYTARKIRHDTAIFERATQHAKSVLHLEQWLHMDIEQQLQHFVLTRMPALMSVLARVYHSHIVVGVVFIVYTYTCLPRSTFKQIRRTIAMDNALAFIILTLWRLTPPRLMPADFGFVDVLHPNRQSGAPDTPSWTNNSFQLIIAAMPSLHFGTSLLLATSLVRFSPHRPLRIVAPLWPAAMLLTILATANHWVLDAVVGAMVPALGWKLNWILASPWVEPVEEWIFLVLRAEKPNTTEQGLDKGVPVKDYV